MVPICQTETDLSASLACVIVCSEAFVKKHNLQNQAIEIVGQSMTTDTPRLFNDRSAIELTGADMTRKAGAAALKQAGISAKDLCVVELHDCCEFVAILPLRKLSLIEARLRSRCQ